MPISRLPLALLTAALLIAMAIAGCGVTLGNGPTRTERRSVAPFDHVAVHGSPDVVVRPGATRSVVVRGGERRLKGLDTRVEGGTLVVEQHGGTTLTVHGDRVHVTVTTPVAMRGAAVEGSGGLELERLHTPALEARVDGSGDLRAAGRIGVLQATLDGSGDLDLLQAPAQTATVSVSGSGDAHVDVLRTLDAALDGSGDLTYAGDPSLRRRDLSGSGTIERR